VILDFSHPSKPIHDALIEAFNSKLRSECLNAHWFLNLQDACEKLEAWRRHYNEERPHSAIGNIPPIMLANSAGETSPPVLGEAENLDPSGTTLGSSANNRPALISAGGKPGVASLGLNGLGECPLSGTNILDAYVLDWGAKPPCS
jgi:putative transposase